MGVAGNRAMLFKAATSLPDDVLAGLPDSVIVKGLVSSELRDIEGEVIRQDGIDWSWFMKYGRLTYGHPATNKNTIGSPRQLLKARLEDGTPATYLEGNLWLRKPLGLQAYLDHQAALAAGDPGMGFSIEGNALERDKNDPRIVCKAIVYTVAIAFQPINPVTTLDPISLVQGIAKALGMSNNDLSQIDENITGFDLGEILRGLVRLFSPSKMNKAQSTRDMLLRGVSDDDLRALRILRKNPDITFADAACLAVAHKQGTKP
jgi:hypothetical protein